MPPVAAGLTSPLDLEILLSGMGSLLGLVLAFLLAEGLYLLAVTLCLHARGPGRHRGALIALAVVGSGLAADVATLAGEVSTPARDASTAVSSTGALAARAALGQDPLAQEWYRPPTPLGLDEYYPVPESNALTEAKVGLGRRLFFDPLLSADRSIACASCHRPERAFSDTVALSVGLHGRTGRNAPSIVNRAYGRTFFRDGRAASLEATVLQPIQSPVEMDLALSELVARLRGDPSYAGRFTEAFEDGVTRRNVARALASYVRTLRSGNAPIDRYLVGDPSALSVAAKAGFALFAGKANCVACHVGPTLSDEEFHNTGVFVGSSDLGRFRVSRREADRGAFRTPTLRNVSLTAPYMHDGSLATLEEVIEFYDGGGNENPHLDPEIRPLGLTSEEKTQLLAFLRALTGETTPP